MRHDWNERAREDAHYYVAFGRRRQCYEEFLGTAEGVIAVLEAELLRLKPHGGQGWKALEIGCGPGRLMLPFGRHFAEIHGVDVSDEMIRLARENLRNVPHAHVHCLNGMDLRPLASGHFDFVYSFAVFQHVPSRDVVFSYLADARRVLKPGGILRFQMNG
jgi:SAM-dependent methyltransferase